MQHIARNLLSAALLSLVLVEPAAAQAPTTIVRKGHMPADSLFRLLYVPIDVPAGVAELRVKESYSEPGKNVLNLGIYGPEGYQVGNPAGFRGWSGGAKTEFFLSAQAASTGYVPGKITPGRWHVLIYPSTIAPTGLDWELAVTLVPGADKESFRSVPAPAAVNSRPGWYRGDLHMHTLHSDGKRTPQELVDEAVVQKLDFIMSTEHNTNSANLSWGQYAKSNLLIINGEEITTTDFGHWNALGLNPTTLIDWRYTPQDSVIARYTAQVHANGGLAIINHPFYSKDYTNGFRFAARHFDGMEVWNGHERWNPLDERALQWWDALLRAGTRLVAIAASDTHAPAPALNQVGLPQTVVQASSLSRTGIMQGLKAGRAYLAATTAIGLTLTARAGAASAGIGDTLRATAQQPIRVDFTLQNVPEGVVTLHGDMGLLATSPIAPSGPTTVHWQVPGTTTFLRVEVRTPKGEMLALTNPIWVKAPTPRKR